MADLPGRKLPPSKGDVMRIRGVWVVLVVLLIIAAPAGAHDHRIDAYGGACAESGSLLGGFHGTVAVPLAVVSNDKVRHLSVLGDANTVWGSGDKRTSNLLVGLRYTFAATPEEKKLPFVHLLVGGANTSRSGNGGWDPAVVAGVGFEAVLKGGADSGTGVRTQLDYIRSSGDNNARVTVGIFKRWPR